MKLLAKYTKPYLLLVIGAIVLLFAQTILELFLPNYMSKLVNIGIVSNGIEETAPKVMGDDAMELCCRFAADPDTIRNDYQWTEPGKASKSLLKTYPMLETEGAWVKNDLGKAAKAELGTAYGQAMYALSVVIGEKDYSSMSIAEMQKAADGASEAALNDAKTQASKTSSGLTGSVAVSFTGVFYKELGAVAVKRQQGYIWRVGGIMLALSLLSGLADMGVGIFGARVSAGTGRAIRRDIFRKVTSFSNEDIDKFSTATLITRSTNDVQQVQMVVMMGIRMVCMAPLYCIGGTVMALQKSKDMSWIVAVAVVLLLSLQVVMFKLITPKFKIMQKLTDKLNLVARESLTGMLVIRAFGNEKVEENRFDQANKDITNVGLYVQRTMATLNPIENLLLSCITLLIVWVGGHYVADFKMPIGDMLAYMQYVMQIVMSFMMIAQMFIFLPRAMVAAGRVKEVLDTEPVLKEKEAHKTLGGRSKGKVEYRDVSFRYGDAENCVLEHISFTAQPGQTVAFIGSTGSGKSTLINLLPRFYDVTSGSILVDGVDVRDLTLNELRNNIGYIPQKGLLFSGDVGTNLSLGKEFATDEEMFAAIRTAQGIDFINPENNGLNIAIAQGGENVSGGQKQRLSIARALIKNPPIFIFDDSFSALDFRTDASLRKALYETTENATVLIVAQRVSTIMNADQIIVLEEGRVVGHGTHRELLKSCEAYREIAESQLTKEELA